MFSQFVQYMSVLPLILIVDIFMATAILLDLLA